MRKRIRPLISMSVLVIMIGAIFFAGKPQPTAGQNSHRSYQLIVKCGASYAPTAAFWHEADPNSMGLQQECAGNCDKGAFTLATALAKFPADVRAILQGKVDKHQADAAAGTGQPLTCLGDGKEKPPEDKGKKCSDNMPEKGSLFASGTTVPVAIAYSEPSTGSQVIGTFPNGTRVVYNQTTRINGQTWYYVHPPGRPAGWIRGGELRCLRPGTPMPFRDYFDDGPLLYPDGSTPRPTAAIVAGARG